MEKALELLKQRRIWASVFGGITLALTLAGASGSFDATVATDNAVKLVEAVSTIFTVGLTLHSYFVPKK